MGAWSTVGTFSTFAFFSGAFVFLDIISGGFTANFIIFAGVSFFAFLVGFAFFTAEGVTAFAGAGSFCAGSSFSGSIRRRSSTGSPLSGAFIFWGGASSLVSNREVLP